MIEGQEGVTWEDWLALARGPGGYAPRLDRIQAHGVSESAPLDFHSPYGCSKGCGDQYVLDYARSFGVPAVVFRMSCIYGPRQFGTEDQGWVAHFLLRALRGERITIYSDGHQVRDLLFVGDLVDAFLAARSSLGTCSGQAFNLGGGPDNAVSVLSVLARIAEVTGREPRVSFDGWRTGDQRYYMGWAQVWAGKMRDDALRQQVMTNPHAPEMYRANAPVRNVPEFYAAFEVKDGDKQFLPPDERVKIW